MVPGATVGHYTIIRKLGSGGMGRCISPTIRRSDATSVLKQLLPEMAGDEERRTRFEREARAVAALNHPNIVTLYSIERDGDLPFITMEFVAGESGGLPLKRFFRDRAAADRCRQRRPRAGVTHRDLN